MLPAVCLLSAVWRQTPTTQATLYQRPDCWRRFLVLLVIDVIKPPGTYFNNWLQLSCRSSKFSSSFLATSVLLYALLDPSSETQGQIKGARERLNGRTNIYGTKKSKERREEPVGTMSYQTSSKRPPPFWLLIGARIDKLYWNWHSSSAWVPVS